MEITLKSGEEEICRGAEAVEALCGQAGFSTDRRDEVRTAVLEALSNAMIHAHQARLEMPIVVRAAVHGSSLLVEILDRGPGPREIPPEPDLEKKLNGLEDPGGWGVHLMRLLASEVDFVVRPGEGHSVRLRFEERSPERPVDARIRRALDA